MDEFGTIMEVKEIQRNLKNDSYWRNNIFASKRIVEDTIYEADTLLGSYSRLVKLTPDGQHVIFENTVGITIFYVVVIAVVCIVLAVFAAFWIVLIKMIIKEMRKNKQQN